VITGIHAQRYSPEERSFEAKLRGLACRFRPRAGVGLFPGNCREFAEAGISLRLDASYCKTNAKFKCNVQDDAAAPSVMAIFLRFLNLN
jgi:hypothetical protein